MMIVTGEQGPKVLYIEMSRIAHAIGWSQRRVKRMLQRTGTAFKLGDRWYTTMSRLRADYPDAADRLETLLEDDFFDPGQWVDDES